MKNLIADLLVRLAEKETESRELVAQVEALEIVVTALLRHSGAEQQQQINDAINTAMQTTAVAKPEHQEALRLLQDSVQRLLHPLRQ